MPRIGRLLVTACLFGAVLSPATVAAQGSPALERVEIALWPEYDQRAMLVIYRIALPAASVLPVTVEVPIPTRVGDPLAVAQQAPDGSLILADYTLPAGDGDWAILAIQAESTTVQVEFYDRLQIDGAGRSYAFRWPAGWPVGDLRFEVMQPVGAADMQIDPEPGSTWTGANGLTYFAGGFGPQDGSAEAVLHLAYSKADAGLTIESASPAAGDDSPPILAAEPAGKPTSLSNLTPWLVGGLGVALLALGAVLLVRSRGRARADRRPRHPTSARHPGTSPSLDASTVFCHACGTPAGVSDVFCRKCGTRLRT